MQTKKQEYLLEKVSTIVEILEQHHLSVTDITKPHLPSGDEEYGLHPYYTNSTQKDSKLYELCVHLEQIGLRVLVPLNGPFDNPMVDYNSFHKISMVQKSMEITSSLFPEEFPTLLGQSILRELVIFHWEHEWEKRDALIDFIVHSAKEEGNNFIFAEILPVPSKMYSKPLVFFRDTLIIQTISIAQILQKYGFESSILINSSEQLKVFHVDPSKDEELFICLETIGMPLTQKSPGIYAMDKKEIKKMKEDIKTPDLQSEYLKKKIMHSAVYKFLENPKSLGDVANDVTDLYLWEQSSQDTCPTYDV